MLLRDGGRSATLSYILHARYPSHFLLPNIVVAPFRHSFFLSAACFVFSVMPGFLFAPGLIGFLSEPDTELQVFALRAANDGISLYWTEFAAHVSEM